MRGGQPGKGEGCIRLPDDGQKQRRKKGGGGEHPAKYSVKKGEGPTSIDFKKKVNHRKKENLTYPPLIGQKRKEERKGSKNNFPVTLWVIKKRRRRGEKKKRERKGL